MTQGGSYTLFSSREQEYEQRSQLLKRLAFVIFCSETDQYHKFMPNIQGALTGDRFTHIRSDLFVENKFCFELQKDFRRFYGCRKSFHPFRLRFFYAFVFFSSECLLTM